MPALALWLNILFGAAAVGIIAGVPLWMVLRHPDRDPAETRSLPAYLRVQRIPPAGMASARRELAGPRAR